MTVQSVGLNATNRSKRKTLCHEYYSLADDIRHKSLLTSLSVRVNRKLNEPKQNIRQISRLYFLKNSNGKPQRMCLKLFCVTFSISHRVVENCTCNMSDSGVYIGHYKRGESRPPNTTSVVAIQFVRKHINCFPITESHYCRRDSQKHYLSAELNISLMYRSYKNKFCVEKKKIPPVSHFVNQKKKIINSTLV